MDDILTTLKAHFKPYPLPALLESLLDYQDNSPTFFAGSFEVDPDEWGALEKFIPRADKRERIKVFGMDGVMALYALWYYDGCPAGQEPVVYISSEGGGNLLMAENFAAFLALIGTNMDYEPFDHEFLESDPETAGASKKFRAWLESKHGIRSVSDPLLVVEAAAKVHPDFQKWLDA